MVYKQGIISRITTVILYNAGRILRSVPITSLLHSRLEQVDEDGPQEQEDGRYGQRLLQLYRRGPEGAAADFRRLARCSKGEWTSSTNNLFGTLLPTVVLLFSAYLKLLWCHYHAVLLKGLPSTSSSFFLPRYQPEVAAADIRRPARCSNG